MRALFAVYYIFAGRCRRVPLGTRVVARAEPAVEKEAALGRSAAIPGTMAVHGSQPWRQPRRPYTSRAP